MASIVLECLSSSCLGRSSDKSSGDEQPEFRFVLHDSKCGDCMVGLPSPSNNSYTESCMSEW